MRLVLSAFAILCLGLSVSEADIYKTVDENGVICYTDVPSNNKAERIIKSQDAAGDVQGLQDKRKTEPNKREYHGIVQEKAAKYEMDPSLIQAVITAESNGNPYAVSRKGARGLMQLMPTTANDLQVRNSFDPEENIDGGTRYLKSLIERFNGDLTLALAAYNAGPKTVEKSGAVPQISETKQYVKKVLALYSGKTRHPVSSPSSTSPSQKRPYAIYKVLAEDGITLFTNLPLNNNYPRF